MADIFLSYSSKDKDRVKPLVHALEREGWMVWWDQELLIGTNYRMMIQEKLEDSKCVLVVWSESSIVSEWVHEEADYAKNNSHLFPAIIDQVKIPLGFGMRQAVNLVGWTGYSTHPEFQKLVLSIKNKIGAPVVPPNPDPKPEEIRPVPPNAKSRILTPTPGTRTVRLPDGKEIQFEMVDLPGGEFQMGGTKFSQERPVHTVRVSPFSIGKYQVTQAQWQAVMGGNPSHFKGETRPVENVSWNDAQQFLKKIGNGYRLPTEAEWEYAARGGTTTEYSFGDDESKLGEYAWFGGNSGRETHPVGQKRPNPFGLHDMHGNVWEWVEDPWHKNYEGAPTDGSAWLTGGDNTRRVLRGGSWISYFNLRSAYRLLSLIPGDRDNSFGFRVVVGAQTQPGR
jgi:formylglycine-generating enzyme required for sulfatase activity